MKPEIRETLEDFQEEIREASEKDEISYSNDGVYGMMIMLDSILNEDLTPEDAVNEFLANSDLEIQVAATETQVVHE